MNEINAKLRLDQLRNAIARLDEAMAKDIYNPIRERAGLLRAAADSLKARVI